VKKNWLKTSIFISLSVSVMIFSSVVAFPVTVARGQVTDIKVEIKQVEPFVYCSLSRTGSFSDIEAAVGELLQQMQIQNVFPWVQ